MTSVYLLEIGRKNDTLWILRIRGQEGFFAPRSYHKFGGSRESAWITFRKPQNKLAQKQVHLPMWSRCEWLQGQLSSME